MTFGGLFSERMIGMAMYICERCGKQFRSHNPKPRFCSVPCKSRSQMAQIDESLVVRLYLSGLTIVEIADVLDSTYKIVRNTLIRNDIERRRAIKRNQYGPNNDSWRGDAAGYAALHRRVAVERGAPQKCDVCGTTDPAAIYDWANLTGHYEDVGDYKRMCRSCHWKYDKRVFNIRHMREKVMQSA